MLTYAPVRIDSSDPTLQFYNTAGVAYRAGNYDATSHTWKLSGTASMTLAADGAFTASQQYRATVRQGSAQTLLDATDSPINFDTEVEDTGGLHSTAGGQQHKITIPTGGDGLYLFIGQVTFAADAGAAGRRSVWLEKNNVAFVYSDETKIDTGALTVQVVGYVTAVATDFVHMLAKQTSGGNLDTVSGAGFTELMAVKVA